MLFCYILYNVIYMNYYKQLIYIVKHLKCFINDYFLIKKKILILYFYFFFLSRNEKIYIEQTQFLLIIILYIGI